MKRSLFGAGDDSPMDLVCASVSGPIVAMRELVSSKRTLGSNRARYRPRPFLGRINDYYGVIAANQRQMDLVEEFPRGRRAHMGDGCASIHSPHA